MPLNSTSLQFTFKPSETIPLSSFTGSDPNVQHDMNTGKRTLGASEVTQVYDQEVTLSSGTYDIDLTSYTDSIGGTSSLSGLRLRVAQFRARATNNSPVGVAPGASNGYDIGFSAHLAPGGEIMIFQPDAYMVDVDGTHKIIHLESAEATAVVDVMIVAG